MKYAWLLLLAGCGKDHETCTFAYRRVNVSDLVLMPDSEKCSLKDGQTAFCKIEAKGNVLRFECPIF